MSAGDQPLPLQGIRVIDLTRLLPGPLATLHLVELGAEVITAGRSETFVPIDTENITEEQLNRLEDLLIVAEAGGQPLLA